MLSFGLHCLHAYFQYQQYLQIQCVDCLQQSASLIVPLLPYQDQHHKFSLQLKISDYNYIGHNCKTTFMCKKRKVFRKKQWSQMMKHYNVFKILLCLYMYITYTMRENDFSWSFCVLFFFAFSPLLSISQRELWYQ